MAAMPPPPPRPPYPASSRRPAGVAATIPRYAHTPKTRYMTPSVFSHAAHATGPPAAHRPPHAPKYTPTTTHRAPRRSRRLQKEAHNAREIGATFWPSVSLSHWSDAPTGYCTAAYLTTGDARALRVLDRGPDNGGSGGCDYGWTIQRPPLLLTGSGGDGDGDDDSGDTRGPASVDEEKEAAAAAALMAVERPWLHRDIVKLVRRARPCPYMYTCFGSFVSYTPHTRLLEHRRGRGCARPSARWRL